MTISDGNLDQGSDSTYIFRGSANGSPKRIDVKCEERKVVMDHAKVFVQYNYNVLADLQSCV